MYVNDLPRFHGAQAKTFVDLASSCFRRFDFGSSLNQSERTDDIDDVRPYGRKYGICDVILPASHQASASS